jgi:ribose 1,5-bisphosphokinase PhnN
MVSGFSENGQGFIIGGNIFFGGNRAQLVDDLIELDGMKAEMLAARPDGLRNVLSLRGRHHENDVRRRLFQGLEQRIERGIGNLVRFIQNINLVAVTRRAIAGGITQFADLINTAIGGRVDFDYIHRTSSPDFHA